LGPRAASKSGSAGHRKGNKETKRPPSSLPPPPSLTPLRPRRAP
jgi:hypothetical protein